MPVEITKFALDPLKISIGTANFHRNYGTVSNNRVGLNELIKIDNLMNVYGIKKIDTAFSYIDFRKNDFPSTFYKQRLVTSKISISDLSKEHVRTSDGLIKIIEKMLNHMGIKTLDALLIHGVSDYCSPDFDWFLNGLNKSKEMGLVSKIGVSIYSIKDFEQYFKRMKIDLIQIPLNPVNQEFLELDFQNLIRKFGIEVQTRSAFLQGALLVPNFEIKTESGSINQDAYSNWWEFFHNNHDTPLSACLNFLAQFSFIESYIFGIESFAQLREIINCKKSNLNYPWRNFILSNQELIDPRLWK